MKHTYALILTLLLAAPAAVAQVGIGTPTPDAAAALDITATGKGLLIPRMDSVTRAGITAPPDGLMVFQTDGRSGFWYAMGGGWVFIPDKTRSGDNLGNHTATQNLNLTDKLLVGGTAAAPSSSGLRVNGSGYVGIGTTSPVSRLSNTSSNIVGTDGQGITGSSLTWNYGSGGYAVALYNSNNGGATNGLAVKVAGAAASNSALDVSQGPSATAAGTPLLRVTGAGNVGIGTTQPRVRLSFANVAEPKITLWDGGASSPDHLGFGVSNGQLNYHVPASNSHVFYTGGKNGPETGVSTELLRLTSSGRLGLNTNGTPGGRFHIVTNTSGFDDDYLLDQYGATGDQALYFRRAGGTQAAPADLTGGEQLGGISFGARFNGSQGYSNAYIRSFYRGDGTTNNTDLRFGTSSAERMRIDSAGNVGIGTGAPGFRLQVAGSFRSSAANGVFSIYNNGPASGTVLLGALDGTGGNGAQLRFSGAAARYADIGQNAAGAFVVEGNDVARLTVQNAGKVGIGTSLPQRRLHVAGGMRVDTLAGTGLRVVTADANGDLGSTSASALGDNLGDHTATQNLKLNGYTLSNNGTGGLQFNNAGMAAFNAAPATNIPLTVQAPATSTTARTVVAQHSNLALGPEFDAITDTGQRMAFGINNSGHSEPGAAYFWNYANTSFRIGTNGTERLRILADGKVGIGTSTPAKRLHVDAANDYLRIDNLASVSNTNNYLVIDNSGNVGKTTVENVAGQLIRLGFNGGNYFENVSTPADAESALRFDQHSSAALMGNAPNGAPNFINTIAGASIATAQPVAAGNGTRARTTDQITLPAGVYRVTVRLSGNYFVNSASGPERAGFVKFIVNNNEYSFVETLNSSANGTTTHTEVSDYLNLSTTSTVDFSVRFLRNFTLLDRAPTSTGIGNSYRSLLLIERVR